MGLREQAAADITAILEDSTTGAAVAVTVVSPGGVSKSMTGFAADIASLIDPSTGMAVSGRMATVALSMASLAALFPSAGMPKGIAESTSRPWAVSFADVLGTVHTFKIKTADPDRTVGLLKCTLEVYA